MLRREVWGKGSVQQGKVTGVNVSVPCGDGLNKCNIVNSSPFLCVRIFHSMAGANGYQQDLIRNAWIFKNCNKLARHYW